jgi:hypothetical protein
VRSLAGEDIFAIGGMAVKHFGSWGAVGVPAPAALSGRRFARHETHFAVSPICIAGVYLTEIRFPVASCVALAGRCGCMKKAQAAHDALSSCARRGAARYIGAAGIVVGRKGRLFRLPLANRAGHSRDPALEAAGNLTNVG